MDSGELWLGTNSVSDVVATGLAAAKIIIVRFYAIMRYFFSIQSRHFIQYRMYTSY